MVILRNSHIMIILIIKIIFKLDTNIYFNFEEFVLANILLTGVKTLLFSYTTAIIGVLQ